MLGVREDNSAYEAYESACDVWLRADEAWEDIKWVLARDPDAGRALNEEGTLRAFTFEGAVSINMPTVVVLYECDGRYVTIRDARFSNAKARQAGRA